MLEKILRKIESLTPPWLYQAGQPVYHFFLALCGALVFRFPSRSIRIIAITGTKGKSTTTELTTSILEAAGYRVASLSTIQFKIADDVRPNKFKMTVPGRFFVQHFLRQAVNARCEWAVVEMSSEAVKQFRHSFIAFDALIFTNLAPEHIERHGSYENYRDEKLRLARAVARSSKPHPLIVANADDVEGHRFLSMGAARSLPYRLADGAPHTTTVDGSTFTFHNRLIDLQIPGVFNIMNALGAATCAHALGVPLNAIVEGLSAVACVRGRVEFVQREPFAVVVDYAHTPESLESLYQTFDGHRRICVLGNTGGGRDAWKRPVMAKIAERYCTAIVLTNEDPYDDDPRAIVNQMAHDISRTDNLSVIMDRREAIAHALATAAETRAEDTTTPVSVLITGKGTDPYIMGARGVKIPWDDATVAREELDKLARTGAERHEHHTS